MGIEYKAAIIRNLIGYHVSEHQEELLKYFSEGMQKKIIEAPNFSKSPLQDPFPLSAFVSNIEVSWLKVFFEKKPKQDLLIYLSALPKALALELSKEFGVVLPSNTLNKSVTQFFLIDLYNWLVDKESPFPVDALPPHPLNELAFFNHHQLRQYIRILSLFDLAAELKNIIQTSLLKEIENEFSLQEKEWIREFSKRKDLLKFPPLKLQNWNGNIDDLKTVLFQRGLNRLAKGLHQASSSLVWYIKHKLPQEHAKTIEVFSSQLKDKKIYDILLKQLKECIDIVQRLPLGESQT